MPKARDAHSLLEMQGDVYLFGGRDADWDFSGSSSAIYKLSCSSGICSWSTINQALKVGRYSTVVIPVPDTFCL